MTADLRYDDRSKPRLRLTWDELRDRVFNGEPIEYAPDEPEPREVPGPAVRTTEF